MAYELKIYQLATSLAPIPHAIAKHANPPHITSHSNCDTSADWIVGACVGTSVDINE